LESDLATIKTLQQLLIEELGKRSIESTAVPVCITDNLNSQRKLRPYQERCFRYFLSYWNETFDGKPRQNHQLLFHMATGSGKTLIMAGLILYLYEKGYRNFLFFVNSNNIIDKTRDNFLNQQSSKYLFAPQRALGDKKIHIRQVYNFQTGNPDDINIVFTTIQGLHMALNNPGENSLTYDDFEDRNIVLLSDEAHHINAETKKGNAKLSQEEMFETVSWEGTVERIFKSNPDNVLLEFTATMDMADENLAAKYNPKLIFDYPLKEFRRDGYSKEVKVLQSDLEPFDRALQAILLSQHRRKLFEKYGKHIKPVLMLKSKTIKESQEFFDIFTRGIKNLSVKQIQAIRSRATQAPLSDVFAYLDNHKIDIENLITEIREDFSDEKLLVVNSKEDSEAKQIAVNSLEDFDNEYRVIFAVDKLNEGWDVLNLFDIIRLYDTRDAKAGQVGKTTMSEAQLIGRGARYCPFQLTSDQSPYERKFDADLKHDLRLCEELYYHSPYNPKYIQELNTALQEIGIKAKVTRERPIKLKDEFKQSALYKAGHIFLNKQIKYNREDITGLDSSLIQKCYKIVLHTGQTRSLSAFDTGKQAEEGISRKTTEISLQSLGMPAIRTALQRLEFYRFDNLKKHLPHLESIQQLITDARYLGNIKLEISGLPDQVDNLDPESRLIAALRALEEIALVVASDKIEYKGTKEFEPFMIKETFCDKYLNFSEDDDSDKEFGKSMNNAAETSIHLDLSQKTWHVFDDCFGTSEEKELIQYINRKYDDLHKKYSEVRLLRNEHFFKLYNFSDGRAFEPDFVLYLVGKEKINTLYYQVFIEPKGAHLLKADEWKEKFLLEIQKQFKLEQLFANKKYAVWGLPFYNKELRESDFSVAFDELIK
jgi:type III restriction enzyme